MSTNNLKSIQSAIYREYREAANISVASDVFDELTLNEYSLNQPVVKYPIIKSDKKKESEIQISSRGDISELCAQGNTADCPCFSTDSSSVNFTFVFPAPSVDD